MTKFPSGLSILFLLLLVFAFNARAEKAAESTAVFTKPSLDISLSAFSLREDALLSRGTSGLVEGSFGYKIGEDFNLILAPVASFVSGQLTSRDPQSPLTNSIYLKKASVEKKINDNLLFQIGALYQKEFLPGIAGHTRSFPSIGLVTPFQMNQQLIELRLQAAVPTSSGLATSTTEFESSSSLLSATLIFKSDWTSDFTTQLIVSHFVFEHLSSAAATDSLQRGNTVTKSNATSGAFVYKYAGDEILFSTEYLFSDSLDIKMKASFIKNNSAPEGFNEGYFYSVAPGLRLKPELVLRPLIERYHVQTDAMVAVFSDPTLGRANRSGSRYGMYFEASKYTLQFIYATSKLIQSNPFQSPDQSFFVNLDLKSIFFWP